MRFAMLTLALSLALVTAAWADQPPREEPEPTVEEPTVEEPTSAEPEEGEADASEEEGSEEPTAWTTKYETRMASGMRTCTVSKPGFTMAVFLIDRGDGRYQALQVGRSKYRDAYLRVDNGRPLRLEDGRLIMPATGAPLITALRRGGTVYIEWTDALRGTQQESTSLQGFDVARQECVKEMGAGFR